MRLANLYRRNVVYHWRAHLAVLSGVVVGTAALTGALLVGDSMRGSLRDAALGRLGRVEYALVAGRFFREALAEQMVTGAATEGGRIELCPAILARGSAAHADTQATALRVNILGVDDRFWKLGAVPAMGPTSGASDRTVVLNQALADALHARPGDDVLLRLGKPSAISTESLLGRRNDTALTLRLTVQRVIPAEDLGAFSLDPQQAVPQNAYVPLKTLQRALHGEARANALFAGAAGNAIARKPSVESLTRLLLRHAALADFGLRVSPDANRGYLALESEALLLEPAAEDAARATAAMLHEPLTAVFAYLANTITDEAHPEATIPYSVVAAVDPLTDLPGSLTLTDGTPAPALAPGEIFLNDWAAHELNAQPNDTLGLSYYVLGPGGQLHTETATFHLRGVVRLAGPAADSAFAPTYPGITDTDSMADWNPPFPIDLRSIRPQDEAYWEKYRTTPKAFVTLADGQRLWANESARLGRLTSLRIRIAPDESAVEVQREFASALLQRLDPATFGLRFEPVRARLLGASEGATDFGGLFIGFSMFLIVSAALLVALLFRLGIERRASEIGLLLAVGFSPCRVAGLLLGEGVLIAAIGSAVGVVAARGYAWLMLAGLRSWWAEAVNAPFLRLHATPASYGIGFVAGLFVAVTSLAWSLRGLTSLSPRALLAGAVASGRAATRRRRWSFARVVIYFSLCAAIILGVLGVVRSGASAASQSLAFFGSGTALLAGGLAALAHVLNAPPRTPIATGGFAGLLRLAVRNAGRHRGRSLLTAGLIAAATFVITALQAMRLDAPPDALAKDSGTGGFTLCAESALPLPYDVNTPAGRAALGLVPVTEQALAGADVIPFRLREGDEASCLNLYRPTRPRVLGAPDALIERGGFDFAGTLAQTESQRRNPWMLLHEQPPDGAIPVIADEATVLWQLHLALGDTLVIPDDGGRDVRLRIVGLLRNSILQGQLIIAESNFTRLFPTIAGHAFFLIEAPAAQTSEIRSMLERELARFSFVVTSARTRLTELFAVQNTYLSAFQTLGGLGLLLGTIGLAAVLLRNVWERRSELALLQALGFSRPALGWLVLGENAALVAAGLLIGFVSATAAGWPQVWSRPQLVPWPSLLLTFLVVLASGLLAGVLALVPALRARLLPALRSE